MILFQPAQAQTKDAPIAFANQDAITTTLISPPNITSTGMTPSPSEPPQWLRVEIHYGSTANVTRDYPFIDTVEFKVWVEGFDLYNKNTPQGAKGVSVVLTGDVTYLNVPMNRDIYGAVYIHPDVLSRYTDDRGIEQFTRKFNVHVEAYANGKLVDIIDKTKEDDPNWYKPLVAVPNLVLRQDQTPFVTSDAGHYPMLKPLSASGGGGQ